MAMQTVLSNRTDFQIKVILDLLPEVTADSDALTFPYGPTVAMSSIRDARKSVKGTGPNNAINAVLKALDKGEHVEVVASEGEVADVKPAKAKCTKKAVPTSPDGLCLCGCGEKVTREFKPGHDARYKGQLIKLVLDPNSNADDSADALAVIESRGWVKFLDKSREAAAAKAERKAKDPKAIKRGKVVGGPTVNLKQLAQARELLTKIGRYGSKAGDRQIECHPEDIPAILSGIHPAYTNEDLVELGFEPRS